MRVLLCLEMKNWVQFLVRIKNWLSYKYQIITHLILLNILHKLHMKRTLGSLLAMLNLENKLKNYLKQDQSDIVKNPNFQKRHISGIEAQKIGLLNTTGERKTVCREEKLPILTCERCSYKTKRPNHLEKHMKKHGILQ